MTRPWLADLAARRRKPLSDGVDGDTGVAAPGFPSPDVSPGPGTVVTPTAREGVVRCAAPFPARSAARKVAASRTIAYRAPEDWSRGIARLLTMPAPSCLDDATWHRLIRIAREFMDLWAPTAARLGWSGGDLWACHPTAPLVRRDVAGLAMTLLPGGALVAVTEASATIVLPTGSRNRFYRRYRSVDGIPIWQLR